MHRSRASSAAGKAAPSSGGKWWLTVKRQRRAAALMCRHTASRPAARPGPANIEQWKEALGESSGLREARRWPTGRRGRGWCVAGEEDSKLGEDFCHEEIQLISSDAS